MMETDGLLSNVAQLEDALCEALRLESPQSEGFTVRELAARLGWPLARVRTALQRLGPRVIVGWTFRAAIDGRPMRVPCYRLRD
jgi:DNA-binding GntR family transcriptional regulator